MLLDARAVAQGSQIDADLCIVGAGPAGITVAREFLGTDVRVCLLESGAETVDSSTQALNRAASVGYSSYDLQSARVRAFGGTSRHWPFDEGWRARPLDRIDFEQRPGIEHTGWPFTRSHLEPFYHRAQQICDLGPYAYDAEDWEDGQTKRLPLASDRVQTTIFQLGSTSFNRYYDELVRAPNLKVVLRAHVAEVATEAQPHQVDHLVVLRDDGRRFSVISRLFVLAAGGIENPRLLLLSNKVHRRGVGNQHDLVGRFFSERLSARAGFLVAARPQLPTQLDLYRSRRIDSARVEGTLRVNENLMREEHLLNCTFFLLPRPRPFASEGVRSVTTLAKGLRRRPRPPDTLRHLRNVMRDLDDVGRAVAESVLRSRHRSDGVLIMRAQAEQAPNPDSRVTLSDTHDRLGLPQAQLCWRISASDRQSIRRNEEIIDQELRAKGLGHIEMLMGEEDPPALFEGNRHHMGTTRMSVDPKQGVVDANSRVHGIANLYVCGSSTLPTFGCSNPTLTLVALSARLGTHLRDVLASRAGTSVIMAESDKGLVVKPPRE